MSRRLKVLVSAYACSPVRGSEPGMGWGFTEAISEYHDLWVITEEEKFRPEIERELSRRPELREHIKFFYVKKNRHRTLRKIWPPSYYWFYRAWQRKAYALALRLHAEIGFDLIHQLNMVGYREPGYLWKLDAPFIWGPIGGLESVPWRFVPTMGFPGCLYYTCYNTFNMVQKHISRRARQAISKASRCRGIVAATGGIQKQIAKVYGYNSDIICEIGLPPRVQNDCTRRVAGETLRIAWSGLHVSGKALPLLLYALAVVGPQVKWKLHILGRGPCAYKWKKLATSLGIESKCVWHGWIPREQALGVMRRMHVFAITSLKDLTSTVTIEALSQGVPVICLDHCGFSDAVTERCGIRIHVGSPAQVIRDIATAVEHLWADEADRQSLAKGAILRAGEYAWDKKAEILNSVYERATRSWGSALRGRGIRPPCEEDSVTCVN